MWLGRVHSLTMEGYRMSQLILLFVSMTCFHGYHCYPELRLVHIVSKQLFLYNCSYSLKNRVIMYLCMTFMCIIYHVCIVWNTLRKLDKHKLKVKLTKTIILNFICWNDLYFNIACISRFNTLENFTLKLQITRHGDRSATVPYPKDPYQESIWPQGVGQLTQVSCDNLCIMLLVYILDQQI